MKIFFKIVFSRTAILFFMLILQLAVIIFAVSWLGQYSLLFTWICNLLAALLVLYIINRKETPEFKLSWIVPILVAPVFGTLLYLFVQMNLEVRLEGRRHKRIMESTRQYLKQDETVRTHLSAENSLIANTAEYLLSTMNCPVYENTSIKYYPLGDDMFVDMLEQLEQAKEFIFMEYFIVKEGKMWNTVLDILQRKVKEGVEVRFMYDGMCSIVMVPHDYPKKLKAMGIKCQQFAPVKPVLSTHQNNRDHRKICVIDGKTAFTGGINLADEYINIDSPYGHWKDTAIMLQGDAVKSFTLMFLRLWKLWEKEKTELEYSRYLSNTSNMHLEEKHCGYVMPYGDSPLDEEPVGEQVYLDIIRRARQYVHIMTPYLILDNETVSALTHAAKSGIDVTIIMPHIPDKMYAYMVARTHYQDLLEEGVKIYEYTPGFVHAKVFVSDDDTAVVGTINLDFRSLYLHFECAALMYKNEVIADIEMDFQNTLKQCQKITVSDCESYSRLKLLLGRILRLVGPMM